ncbi:MAG: isoprenylcysteine carboxylmethyltransferase family protein [Planctomycetota bacterium]
MPLREEFVEQGRYLFQRRSMLPVYFLPLVALAIFVDARLDPQQALPWFRWSGFGITLLGLLIRAITVGPVPKRTSGRGTKRAKAAKLNTDGMYSVCRHPIYLGNFLSFLGAWVASGNWSYAALYTMIYWVYYERIMVYEEEFLREKFGDEYLAWSERTPAFTPRFSQWTRWTQPFSWRMLLRREATAWFGVAVGFVVIQYILSFEQPYEWRIEPHEIGLVCFGAVLYLISRTLRKNTRVLEGTESGEDDGASDTARTVEGDAA